MYARIASGLKTTVSATDQANVTHTGWNAGPPIISALAESAAVVSGLIFTKDWSQPGIVLAATPDAPLTRADIR